eukprot:TRINITY_DN807_c0_g2_i2.p1 TRINITY_DN807_c0_g2~~TRINITY_DN807_c0_g2_i2.p1  ORF type:complete len:652 (+),score=205.48 TRINITY_DN807_c0_g2_i2:200-2155(+)
MWIWITGLGFFAFIYFKFFSAPPAPPRITSSPPAKDLIPQKETVAPKTETFVEKSVDSKPVSVESQPSTEKSVSETTESKAPQIAATLVPEPQQAKHEPEQAKREPEQPKHEPEHEPEQPKHEPEHEPEQPEHEPEQPKHEPEHEPEQPKHEPEQPEYEPEQPKHEPEQPKHEPEQPKHEPEQPKHEPEQPKPEQHESQAELTAEPPHHETQSLQESPVETTAEKTSTHTPTPGVEHAHTEPETKSTHEQVPEQKTEPVVHQTQSHINEESTPAQPAETAPASSETRADEPVPEPVLQTRPRRGVSFLTPKNFKDIPVPKPQADELVKLLEEEQHSSAIEKKIEEVKPTDPILQELPSQIKISELVDPEPPVCIAADASMDKTLSILMENKITVAPVEKYGKWIGLIDMLDITQQALQVFSSSTSGNITSEIQTVHQFNMLTLEDQNIINKSQRNPLVTVASTSTLADVVKELRTGLRRVVVLNESGKPWRLFSPLDAAATILKNPKFFFREKADATLQELGFCMPIFAVSAGTLTIEAFQMLIEKGTSSVAVVNDYWQLVGVVSSSDIKWLRGFRVSLLRQPLSAFLAQSRLKEGLPTNHTVTSVCTATLKEVCETLVQKQVSRSYIIDEHWRPIGVITLTGVLKHIHLE